MSLLKRVAVTSLLLATAPAWANGFYVGVGAGPEYTDYNQTSRVLVSIAPPTLLANVKDKTHLAGTGIFGTLFAGYGYAWANHFYLAGELNADISSDEVDFSNAEYVSGTHSKTSYKMENVFGVSVLPGYLYKDLVLFYGRLGYANGNYVSSTSDPSLVSANRRINGFRYGLGISATVIPQLAARLEFSQTVYQQMSFTATPAPATKTTQITPTTNQVEFSLAYQFA